MVPLPVRIYRHWIGYVAILLAGALTIGLLWVGFLSFATTPGIDHVFAFQLAFVTITVVLAITVIQLYVYSLSYIDLSEEGIRIKNWVTLFVSKDELFEWTKVSRATAALGGFFGQILDYGVISIETSGGSIQASMKTIPRVEYWQNQIQLKADQFPTI